MNGDDRNWVRICITIDGFRSRHNCWPIRVRVSPSNFANVVGHVLSPAGFALVSTVFDLVSDNDLETIGGIIAEGADRTEFRYGEENCPEQPFEPRTSEFFGSAVFRQGLSNGLEFVTLYDSEGNQITFNAGSIGKGEPKTIPIDTSPPPESPVRPKISPRTEHPMDFISFHNAFYIKLGQAGAFENESIETGKLRFGWKGQAVEDINASRWDLIEQQLRNKHQGKPGGVAMTKLNALKNIVESPTEDVWITFHKTKLWWTRLAGPVEQDRISKFRRTSTAWSDQAATGRLLVINELPGKITQLQGFKGAVCRVKYKELLERTLNGTRSPLATAISAQLATLAQHLSEAIKELHWKDFETLVDLVFRAAGWVRVSVLGQQAKGYDLELRESITGLRYVVQVKSQAGKADLLKTVANFSPDDFRRVFFVVHSPEADLAAAIDIPAHVEIVSPERLGILAVNAGLAGWIEDKVA